MNTICSCSLDLPQSAAAGPPARGCRRMMCVEQVYLQVAQTGEAQDWNARFSGMMFKVLQDSYAGSGLAKESYSRTEALAAMTPDKSGWHPVRPRSPQVPPKRIREGHLWMALVPASMALTQLQSIAWEQCISNSSRHE